MSKKESTLFDDIPYDFVNLAKQIPDPIVKQRLIRLQLKLEQAQKAYPNRTAVTLFVQQALQETQELEFLINKNRSLPKEQQQDLLFRLQKKKEQLDQASAVASNIQISMSATQSILTRGAKSSFTIQIQNAGRVPITQIQVKPLVQSNWKVQPTSYSPVLLPNKKKTISLQVQAPRDALFFDPYAPSAVRAQIQYRLYGVMVKRLITIDPKQQTITLLPDWGLYFNPDTTILNTEKIDHSKKMTVQVTNFVQGTSTGIVTPSLPAGWTANPSSISVSFEKHREMKQLQFTVTAPDQLAPKDYEIPFKATVNGQIFSTQVQKIHYNHIGTSYLLTDGNFKIQAFPLKQVDGLKIGYVSSGFDQVDDYLRQAGLNVVNLDEQALTSGDLSYYDTIVVGIRAYLSRPDLLKHNDRLLNYVKNGGHVVMQYHKPQDNWSPKLAPYPLIPGDPPINWRVTDETAPVTFLEPDHHLLQYPNQITSADFDGWVQERGVYFPSSWDPAYKELLSMADPGEKPFHTGVLVSNYGKGTYIYTSLVWYREIQSLVPGAYRFFTNMVSYQRAN